MISDEAVLAERRIAVRALLKQPLLTASSEAPLGAVRRHVAWLRDFFAENFGWTLHVERELVRLGKTPGNPSAGNRAAMQGEGAAFSKRRYVIFCLALAAVERMDRQTTLQRIAENIVSLATMAISDVGFAFSLTVRDDRRELVAVVRTLLSLDVLRRVQGDEEAFVADKGDALYRIDRTVLARLINARRPPSTVGVHEDHDRIAALVEEPHVETEDANRRALRHRLARRLVDDPVLYYADLSVEEREYLHRARAAILKPILEATGLEVEARAEGLALVDPERELTDVSLPEEGTSGHVALLIADFLAMRIRAGDTFVSDDDLARHVRDLIAVHGKYWRKAAREEGAEAHLAREAVDLLAALDLVRRRRDGVEPLPAVARFALLPPRVERAS